MVGDVTGPSCSARSRTLRRELTRARAGSTAAAFAGMALPRRRHTGSDALHRQLDDIAIMQLPTQNMGT
jgi:hypothetical protein